MPGILRWMIDGCLEWLRIGLTRPPVVVEATQAYFEAQDLFGQWLEECCHTERGNGYKSETSANLFASYQNS
jgi:putative DNA primase/helicase